MLEIDFDDVERCHTCDDTGVRKITDTAGRILVETACPDCDEREGEG